MPIPNVTIPGVPTSGECCLTRLHKKAEGERRASFDEPYKCGEFETIRGKLIIRLKLASEGPPCDESMRELPDGCQLEANGFILRRVDAFAHYFGRIIIRTPTGAIIFRGVIETFDRMGTHHPPFGSEECNQQGHLEGWLIARGANELAKYTLRALITARASLPTDRQPAPIFASIDGTLILCP